MSGLSIIPSTSSTALAAMVATGQQLQAPFIGELQQVKNSVLFGGDNHGEPQRVASHAQIPGPGFSLSAVAANGSLLNGTAINGSNKESQAAGQPSKTMAQAEDCRKSFKSQSIDMLLNYASKDGPPIDRSAVAGGGGMACPYPITYMAEACFLAMQTSLTSAQAKNIDNLMTKLATTLQKTLQKSPEALNHYQTALASKMGKIEGEMTAMLKPILGSQPETAAGLLRAEIVDPFVTAYAGQQIKGEPLSLPKNGSQDIVYDQAALLRVRGAIEKIAEGSGNYILKLGLINNLLLGMPHYLVKPQNNAVQPLAEPDNQRRDRLPEGIGSRPYHGNGAAADGHPSGNIMINSGNTTIINNNFTTQHFFQPINVYNLHSRYTNTSFSNRPAPEQHSRMSLAAGPIVKNAVPQDNMPLLSATEEPVMARIGTEPVTARTETEPAIPADDTPLTSRRQQPVVTYSDAEPVYTAETSVAPATSKATSSYPTVAPPASVVTSVSGLRRANHPAHIGYPAQVNGLWSRRETGQSESTHGAPGTSPSDNPSKPLVGESNAPAEQKTATDWPEVIIPQPVLTSLPGQRRANQSVGIRQSALDK